MLFVKIKRYFFFFLIFSFLWASEVFAKFDVRRYKSTSGLADTAEKTGHASMKNINRPIEETIALVVQVFLSILGVVFMGLIMYGGYIWMIAQGNQEKVKQAQKIISESIIGLIIVLAAYAIVHYIGANLREPFTTDATYNFQGI